MWGAPHGAPLSPHAHGSTSSPSSLTFATYWSRGPFQTALPGPSWLPHGACLAWQPIFSGGARGPGSALRCLHVCRGHLRQEVGKFGYGVGRTETCHEGGMMGRGQDGDSLQM